MTLRLFENRPYWTLCGIVFIAMLLRTATGVWGGDFWEHAAVIRELMTYSTEPRHPLIAADAPNAFMTPYSVALAAVARWFSLSPITVLSMAGMVNLVVLFIAFERFVVSVFGSGRTAFYGLLFHLFLWGWQPWNFSGFLHFGTLGYVLPYPSTLAIAFVFFGLVLTIAYLQRPRFDLLLGLFVLSAFVLLLHALSALVLIVGQGSLIVAQMGERPLRAFTLGLRLAGTFCAAFGAAAFWPYFPFLKLVAEKAAFHDYNVEMYEAVLTRIFPALVGLLPLGLRWRANRFDSMSILFASLSAIYAYGWLSGLWAYGRVLAFMVLILHLAMADWLAKHEHELSVTPRRVRTWLHAGVISLAIFALVNFRHTIREILPTTPNNYDRYVFLAEHVGQHDVVMADVRTSWFVPPFAGKVVASRSMAFIPDRDARLADVRRFFSVEATPGERRAMLEQYKVDYVLLNKWNRAVAEMIHAEAAEWANPVYSDANFELLQLTGR
jgi:alpha-1,6-mannosyltransferase